MNELSHAGVVQLVRAPACHAGAGGSSPRSSCHFNWRAAANCACTVRPDKTGFEPRPDPSDARPGATLQPSAAILGTREPRGASALPCSARHYVRPSTSSPHSLRAPSVVNSLLPRNDPPHVLEEHEEMHRVRRGGDEIEFQVKASRFFVLRMHCESANASNIGRPQRAQHRVLQ